MALVLVADREQADGVSARTPRDTFHGTADRGIAEHRSPKLAPKSDSSGTSADEGKADLDERLGVVESSLQRMVDSQAALTAELRDLVRSSPRSEVDTAREREEAQADMTPDEQTFQAAAEIAATIDHLDDVTQAEAIDPEWAPEALGLFHDTFGSAVFEGFELIEADCRTTICRAEIRMDAGVSSRQSYLRLLHDRPWNGAGFLQIDGDSSHALVYLAREGEEMPERLAPD